MRENSCGSFAMEAVTLVARALGRLEVGELSVVRFGGAGTTLPLHPLERPFTDADGPRILSQLRFDQVRECGLSTVVIVQRQSARRVEGDGVVAEQRRSFTSKSQPRSKLLLASMRVSV